MKVTRRSLMAGAAAIPAVVGLERLSASSLNTGALFVYDASLPEAAQRRVEARKVGLQVCEITGDRIRFARDLASLAPARISGFSRQADALLIGEAAVEAGYRLVETRAEGPALAWEMVRRA